MHDKLHLWLYDLKNRYHVLQYIAEKKAFELDRDTCTSSIDIERPIFSNNKTRRFIIDAVVDLVSVKHCGVTNGGNDSAQRLYSTKSFSGKNIQIAQNSVYRRFILEIKPVLLSISQAIAQVKSYQFFLQYHKWYNGIRNERPSNPDLIILTIDVNDSFDEMLASQNINIFHINPKEIKR